MREQKVTLLPVDPGMSTCRGSLFEYGAAQCNGTLRSVDFVNKNLQGIRRMFGIVCIAFHTATIAVSVNTP